MSPLELNAIKAFLEITLALKKKRRV